MNSLVLVWDFNGTLLNDMQVCIDCMNQMLGERGLPGIDLERYREVFTFPVREYYMSLGFDFDKEPFDIPAHQFIDLYRKNLHYASLHPDAVEMLNYFRKKNVRQVILSAMEQEFLLETLESKGILTFFDKICGITNHLGEGKLEMARELISQLNGGNHSIVMVGDTIHDYEVAKGSGIPCVLVAQGHQSFERLEGLDCTVLKDLKQISSIF